MKGFMFSKIIPFCLWGLAIIIMIVPGIGNATTFHVAKTGNDSNSGTKFSPFQTIKKGIGQLAAGDTLYVQSGTYSESILSWQTPIPNGTSWNNPITIATYPGDTVTINPLSGAAFFWIQDGQAKYLIIDGFIVDGQKKGLHGLKFSNNSRYIRVQNSEIKNSTSNGILVSICSGCASPATAPHDTYHEFINLKVHDNGSPLHTPAEHGFYIETSHNLVENSKFYNNAGNGGKFYHGNLSGVSNYNIARNNIFHDNSTAGQWSCGLILSSGEGNMAYNNIAYGNFAGFCIAYRTTNARLFNNISFENDQYGIYVGMNTTDKSYVENNTLYKNNGYGIFVGDAAKNTKVSNNIAYLNTSENIGLQNQTGTIISHNLTTDPLFENANARDFHLKNESPAIDKGDFLSLIINDFTGTSRPQGAGYDIGAYEGILEVDRTPPAPPRNLVAK
jgi:parallel beta-helix repeat protein